jgi:hypothetical protein
MSVQRTWKQALVTVFLVGLVCVLGFSQFEFHLPGGIQPETTGGGEAIDFGAVPVGQTKTASYTFKILETSETSGTVTQIGFAGGAFAAPPFSLRNLPNLPVTLPPGGSITFTVVFTPTTTGSFTGSFTITAQGGVPLKITRRTVALRGQGTYATFEAPSSTTTQPLITWPQEPTVSPGPDTSEDLAALKTQLDAMEGMLNEACQKVDNLAGILGEWIVGRGTRFQVEPGTASANPPAPIDGIKPEIEGLERRMDDLLATLGEIPPTLPAVEVTATSGERFRRFLSLADDLLVRTAEDIRAINPEDGYTRDILDRFSDFAQAGRGEVAQLIDLSHSIPLEIQAQLDAVVVEGAPELLYEITTAEGKTPKLRVEMDGGGNELASTILSKAGSVLSGIPVVGSLLGVVLEDAAKLFEGNSELAQLMSGMALAQLELELKLDAIVRGLFGVSIDETMDESSLRDQLRRIAQGDIPQRFTGLEETLDELRQKLDNLATAVGMTLRGTPYRIEPDDLQTPDAVNWRRSGLINQIELLRIKLDNLAEILGESLYGRGFDIEPQAMVTSPVGEPAYDPIKPEIRQLEADAAIIRQQLEEILRRLPPANGGGTPPGGGLPPMIDRPDVPWFPKDGETVNYYEYVFQTLAVTKKIYVYKEGSFVATAARAAEEIRVRTDAFDLSGWIDLSELRAGDAATITVEVSVAGGPFRTWSTTTFRGEQARGLKSFADFADGLEQVVGTDIKILIALTSSADTYATAIPIHYQFVVESQN